jgi:hypothetical protein
LQPGWPHRQSISGVSCIASHCGLQYLPDFAIQLHGGWAHFLAFSAAINSFPIQESLYEVALPRAKCKISAIKAKISNKWIIADPTWKTRNPPSQNTTSIAKSTMNTGEPFMKPTPYSARPFSNN